MSLFCAQAPPNYLEQTSLLGAVYIKPHSFSGNLAKSVLHFAPFFLDNTFWYTRWLLPWLVSIGNGQFRRARVITR